MQVVPERSRDSGTVLASSGEIPIGGPSHGRPPPGDQADNAARECMMMKLSSRQLESTPARRFRFGIASLAVVILLTGSAASQTVPTGVQEYFILGWEQHIWDMMDRVQNAQGGAQFDDGMNSVVTATASADNQVIYYDHWEDGIDAGLRDYPDSIPASRPRPWSSAMVIRTTAMRALQRQPLVWHRHPVRRRLRQLQFRPGVGQQRRHGMRHYLG